MGFKEISREQNYKGGHNLWETTIVLKCPAKYDKLSPAEVNNIQNVIPASECLVIVRQKDGTYLKGFDLTKKQIEPEKLIAHMKNQFWNALKRYNDETKT